jgi:hypothetical protein
MMRVIPEKHTSGMTLIMHAFLERPSSYMLFWNDPHRVCFSGMTLIMHAFLERPSSCMLFWNDSHHVCFSGSFQKSIPDEGHSRKAYMMRVFPERHA